MVKAVIFDLDDTLISERKYIESGFQHISNLLSKRFDKDSQLLYQELLSLFTEDSKKVFNRFLDKVGIYYTEDFIMELVEEYRNHVPNILFFDDVIPCLETLKKQGIKTGIITDGYANSQRQKLKVLKAYDYFDEIIVTDELGREYWKPHPKAFEMIKERLQIEFNELVYVGDNPEKDFYIRAIYPVKTIRVLREEGIYNGIYYKDSIKENYAVNSLLDIFQLMGTKAH